MAAGALRGVLWPRAAAGLRAARAALAAPSGARAASEMSKDTMPGPYPRTPEERAAAAKKYNMRVEDYQPYPDDGMGYGDYPMLPNKSQYERDPWYQWDQPDMRYNWGEPMHWDFDMYIRNRADTSPTVVPWHTMSKHFLLFLGTMLIMFGLGEIYPSYRPVGPKQYPFNDLYLERGGDPNKEPPAVIHYEI
ncbi:NADH dehydrogenase [ubiquinone] 1 beta subcomplex subunit 8, mitochondrial [Ammospiza nelsoni]|uniref:NADH dehydrogenase [ubiquinone] 1 beta subcomplex subunit 8, mitochondrial n=1 Tax=Ammospiza caudacuta TaxID=2857398 RepID=UPI002738E010|nr:NADH dehydrogenase [ubiquinone] 1 beta subcomplex subunit 8, mitochondrial [Ammospiza caudacuta]XP_059333107.1 NADH dehydrogenase [ubiquinone] 1 beta subcomplex subunit 8, mitochondrial [Ammospiza nelsoni]